MVPVFSTIYICHKVVSVLQEWFLYYVLYDICHKVVSVLNEWLLYFVLYAICHKVVSVLQEWFLYSVLYDFHHTAGFYTMCYNILIIGCSRTT